MLRRKAAGLWRAAVLFLVPLLLVACSKGGGGGNQPEFADLEYQRIPPPIAMPEAPGIDVVANEGPEASAQIDLSNVNQGYVAASCKAAVNVRFQVSMGSYSYIYILPNDGSTHFFPLAMGSGNYSFVVFVQTTGTEYIYFLQADANVQLSDEKAPFLVPNEIVNYTADSKAVQFSYELAQHASSDLEIIQQVYYWIQNNIRYDQEKVAYVQENTSYVPNVDEVLQAEKGICYDYAALAAAMLRANGIPCQLIMGNVKTPDGGTVLHAWNTIWTDETGWITVEMEVNPNNWERIDLTFAASNGDISQFVGDGQNYAQMSVH